MAAMIGTVAQVTSITAVGVEVGLIGAAASAVCLGIWGIHKARKAL